MSCDLCEHSLAPNKVFDCSLCDTCDKRYLDKELTVYQARTSSKRKSLVAFEDSVPHRVTGFRKKQRSDLPNKHYPRLRRLSEEFISCSSEPHSPEILLGTSAAQCQNMNQPILFSPQQSEPAQDIVPSIPGNGQPQTVSHECQTLEGLEMQWREDVSRSNTTAEKFVEKLKERIKGLEGQIAALKNELKDPVDMIQNVKLALHVNP